MKQKKEVLEYLDKYNEGKSDDDKIIYTDYAETITTLSGGIMDAITIVLIAFSTISLIVSTIMIAIITYISVLERTKEIGILRAIGARKKDVTRVFNAETFIIGLCSGILGILIANLLTIPINKVILNLTQLENVAKLNPMHAITLIIISIVLTLIGGWIPAKMASKKEPSKCIKSRIKKIGQTQIYKKCNMRVCPKVSFFVLLGQVENWHNIKEYDINNMHVFWMVRTNL